MAGETDLDSLLAQMRPQLVPGDFVFCSSASMGCGDLAELQPLASFQEEEGLSLVLREDAAIAAGLSYESVFSCISLTVHSSLEAVGLTAVIATRLAAEGISANVIAAYHHDHVLVPKDKGKIALELLSTL